MLFKEISLINYLFIIILFILICCFVVYSCCTINYCNFSEIFNLSSCKVNLDFGITKDVWFSKKDDSN